MARYRLDPTRSAAGVTVRPSLVPGRIRARLLDATVDVDEVAGPAPSASGTFRVEIDGLPIAAPLLGAGRLPWDDGELRVDGRLVGLDRSGEVLRLRLRVEVAERSVPLGAAARLEPSVDDNLRVAGRTLVDPRSFGVPLPPLVNLVVHVRWQVVLEPEHDPAP